MVGLTLHEAITGRRVLVGQDEMELMRAAAEQELAPPSRLRPEVPPERDGGVRGLLERALTRRTATGAEVRQQLLALTGEAAPFPQGQTALAYATQQALLQVRSESGPVSSPRLVSGVTGQLLSRSG